MSIQRPIEPTSAKAGYVEDSIDTPKQIFYLHVGLHKTVTTFLQLALSDDFLFTEPLFL